MKNGPYEMVIAPEGYPGKKYRGRYAYEHIVVWWGQTGAMPPAGYEIHHKDMNHRNNDPSNLEILTREEHSKLHGKLNKRLPVSIRCANCGITFVRTGRNVKYRLKVYGRGFCSRSCQVTKQQEERKKL